jgi:hypothetical protein
VEWIHLAQDRDRLRAALNTGMNLLVLAPRNYYLHKLFLISVITYPGDRKNPNSVTKNTNEPVETEKGEANKLHK